VNIAIPSPTPSEPAAAQDPVSGADALYERIAAEFAQPLARLARAYEADAALRQDLLQEIQIALWQSLRSFDRRCSLRTWVYRVAHNAAASHASRGRRRRPQAQATLEELEQVAHSQNTEESVDREQAVQRLSALIALLAPLDRQVMLLYLEDFEAEAIAAVTGLAPGNVATKVHRIKALLARRFRAEDTP
jgi:RNA polymerase sigma-70 factor (ECF subfamily)